MDRPSISRTPMGNAAGKKRPNAAKKDEAVPKGAAFMPGVDLKRLIKAHKKEKAGKSKYRLHAACLRKEGMDIREISRNGDCLDGEGAADCRLLGPPLNVDHGP